MGFIALGLGALAACESDAEKNVRVLCAAVCACEGGLPSDQDECFVECSGELAPIAEQIPEECVRCIGENADRCDVIDDACEPFCDIGGVPEPEPDPTDFIDAPMF